MKRYKIFFPIGALILLFVGFILSYRFSYISSDAPYYLMVAKDISQGAIPYKDLYLSYTPLMMYLNSLMFLIFEEPDYNLFLLFQFLVVIIILCFFYKTILSYFNLSISDSLLLSSFFGISILSSDGSLIILEVYSILMVMIAFLFFQKGSYFIVGIFLGLSFFFKQYGLLNFFPFFIYIFMTKKDVIKRILKISIGGLIPLAVFLIYFLGYENLNLSRIITQIGGIEYIQYSLLKTPNLINLILGAKVFLLLLLVLIFLPLKIFRKKYNILLLTGLCINLTPVILQSFQHYYINCFPYLFLMIAYNWKDFNRKILVPISISFSLIALLLYVRNYRYHNILKEQIASANELKQHYPSGSSIFLYGEIRYMYILNNYNNPLKKEVGYSYPYMPNVSDAFSETVLSNKQILGLTLSKTIQIDGLTFFEY